MLCDQASDKIFFIYQTTSHQPPVSFYYRIDQLSTARREINPAHCSEQLWGLPPCPALVAGHHTPCVEQSVLRS